MGANLEKIKAAMQAWNDTKGANRQIWLDLIAEDFVMETVNGEGGLPNAATKCGPALVAEFFENLLSDWRMEFYHPETFLEDGDYVAMFGRCRYTFKRTNVAITTPIANLWHFRDGKICRFVELIDSAHAMTAMTPG